jgi:phage antirepressor YoqD-like protein
MSDKIMTKDYVEYAYHTQGKSFQEIAEELGTYGQKVRRFAMANGIAIKSKSDAILSAVKSGRLRSPTQGRKRTDEERAKIGRASANVWKNLSKEELNKRIETSRGLWKNMSEQQRIELKKSASEGCRKAAANGSKAEKYLCELLRKNGYIFEEHKKHVVANEKIHLDIFLPSLSVAIEVNGPSHAMPVWGETQFQRSLRADQRKTGLLGLEGIILIKVWFMGEASITRCATIGEELLNTIKSIEKNGRKDLIIHIGEKP